VKNADWVHFQRRGSAARRWRRKNRGRIYWWWPAATDPDSVVVFQNAWPDGWVSLGSTEEGVHIWSDDGETTYGGIL
jgi:hypothetical protein